MSWSMTARARCTSWSTRCIRLDRRGTGLGMHDTRWERVFVAGGAISLALAVVCERVLRAGAESGTDGGLEGLQRFDFAEKRDVDMATGASDGWLVMERVKRDRVGSCGVCTLGRLGGLLLGCTLGTLAPGCCAVGVVLVAAVVFSKALRAVMSWVGAVMPLSAAAHATTACMSLLAGVRAGLVIAVC